MRSDVKLPEHRLTNLDFYAQDVVIISSFKTGT